MKNKGVKVGYRHAWKYNGIWREKKISPRTWRVYFYATKRKKSKSYGNFKKGFGILWGLKNVKQVAIKTNKGQYQTMLTGIKYPIKTYNNKNRKFYKVLNKIKLKRRQKW